MARKSIVNVDSDVKIFCDHLRKGGDIVVFDTETTGLNNVKDRIITLSAIKIAFTGGTFTEVGRMDIMMNPRIHIPESASAVNGIYDKDVADLPVDDYFIADIKAFFGDAPYICGYNSNFDIGFMNSLYNRQLFSDFEYACHLDVMKMAKQKLGLPNYKLVTVAHELGADIGMHAHTSIDDVIMTWRVCEILLPYYKEETKPKKNYIPVSVYGARYWSRGHKSSFIFLNTYPKIKCYYNIYKKEWKGDDDVDINDLVSQVMFLYKVDNERELVKAVCKKEEG